MWDRQAGPLAERYRLVRYDTRGHGGTEAPPGPYAIADLAGDVLALLDTLGVERASFCGLSIGGMTGMWLASHAPERIDRLVLASTTAYFGGPEQWIERIALVRSQGTAAVADGAIERWLTPEFVDAEPETAEWLKAMIASVDDEGYAACCEALRDMDLRGDVSRHRRADADRGRQRRPLDAAGPRPRAGAGDRRRAGARGAARAPPAQRRASGGVHRRGARTPGGPHDRRALRRGHAQAPRGARRRVGRRRDRAHDALHAGLPGAHHPLRVGRDLDAARPGQAHAAGDHDHRAGGARPPRGARDAPARGAARRHEPGRHQGGPAPDRDLLRRAGGQLGVRGGAAGARRGAGGARDASSSPSSASARRDRRSRRT